MASNPISTKRKQVELLRLRLAELEKSKQEDKAAIARRETPFETATAQFGGPVGPAVERTPEEKAKLQKNTDLINSIGGSIPELGLGTAGGFASSGLPLLKRSPLIGLMFGGGEAIKQIGQQAEKAGLVNLPFIEGKNAPSSSLESLKRIGSSIVGGAVAEVGGTAIEKVASPIGTFFGRQIKKVIPEAKAINRHLEKYGTTLTASQATDSTLLDIADNIARNGPFSAGGYLGYLKKQAVAGEGMVEQTIGEFMKKASEKDVGVAFASVVSKGDKLAKEYANTLYAGLDTIVGNKRIVPFSNIIKESKNSPLVARSLKRLLAELKVGSKRKFLTFSEARELRSALLTQVRNEAKGGKLIGRQVRTLNAVEHLTDDTMETVAKSYGIDAEWRAANTARKHLEDTFRNKFIKSLVKEDATTIGKQLAKLTSVEDIAKVKAVVDKGTFSAIQDAFRAELIRSAGKTTNILSEVGSTQIIGKTLKNKLANTESRKLYKAILGKEGLRKLDSLADTLFLIQEKQGVAIGGVVIQLMTSRAVVGLLTAGAATVGVAEGKPGVAAGAVVAGGAILLAPAALSKLLRSKKGMDILLEGATTVRGSAKASKVMSRILFFLGGKDITNSFLGNINKGPESPFTLGASTQNQGGRLVNALKR